MSILKPAKILGGSGGGSGGSVTVENITDATALGKSLLKAKDTDEAKTTLALGTAASADKGLNPGDVLQVGACGIAGATPLLPVKNTLSELIKYGGGKFAVVEGSADMPASDAAYSLEWVLTAGTPGSLQGMHGTVSALSLHDVASGKYPAYHNVLINGVWKGWDKHFSVNNPPTATQSGALGNAGNQVLDGELTVTDGLTIRSPNQTSANVVSFFFGPDDGVLDASIKATATLDNHGQLALGVRDDTGNVINALTIDGNAKAIMVQPGYKVYVGNSAVDISGITPFGKKLLECQDAAALKTLLGI